MKPDVQGPGPVTVRLGLFVGVLATVAGFSAIGTAWYQMGNTDQLWIQNQELLSGGVGGLGLILLGAVLLVRDALLAERAVRPSTDTTVLAANGTRHRRDEPLRAEARPRAQATT